MPYGRLGFREFPGQAKHTMAEKNKFHLADGRDRLG